VVTEVGVATERKGKIVSLALVDVGATVDRQVGRRHVLLLPEDCSRCSPLKRPCEVAGSDRHEFWLKHPRVRIEALQSGEEAASELEPLRERRVVCRRAVGAVHGNVLLHRLIHPCGVQNEKRARRPGVVAILRARCFVYGAVHTDVRSIRERLSGREGHTRGPRRRRHRSVTRFVVRKNQIAWVPACPVRKSHLDEPRFRALERSAAACVASYDHSSPVSSGTRCVFQDVLLPEPRATGAFVAAQTVLALVHTTCSRSGRQVHAACGIATTSSTLIDGVIAFKRQPNPIYTGNKPDFGDAILVPGHQAV